MAIIFLLLRHEHQTDHLFDCGTRSFGIFYDAL